MMIEKLAEENGVYAINCVNAVWATDKVQEEYHKAGIHINDVDFVIESVTHLFMVEYKNACVSEAANPKAFRPEEDKKISVMARKFYDSLHYIRLLGKNKPVQYIYVLEYPNGDATTRRRLRNRLKVELPFALQENIGMCNKLIDKVDVVSVAEWNADECYGKYPIEPV